MEKQQSKPGFRRRVVTNFQPSGTACFVSSSIWSRSHIPEDRSEYGRIKKNSHWETVSKQIWEIIPFLENQPFLQRFYLTGGTALTLQLGHHKSFGLDFFSERDEVLENSRAEIVKTCSQAPFPVEVLENADGNLFIVFHQTLIGFFGCGYPLIEPFHWLNGCPVRVSLILV